MTLRTCTCIVQFKDTLYIIFHISGHLILYPEAAVMPVASLLVSTRRLLLDVGAVHTRGHRVIGEAGLVPVSDIPSLVISRQKDDL